MQKLFQKKEMPITSLALVIIVSIIFFSNMGLAEDSITTENYVHTVEVFFPSEIFPVKLGEESFALQVADTPEAIKKILSELDEIDVDKGILFIFPSEDHNSITMENTSFSFTLAFIKDDCEILELHEMSPFSTVDITSKTPIQFAIALKTGSFERCAATIGSYFVPISED